MSDEIPEAAALHSISTPVCELDASSSFSYSNLCEAVGTARAALGAK